MIHVREHVPLSPLTTFEIGGAARYFVEVETEDEIREVLAFAREHELSTYIIAGGSNVLVPDAGLNGLVMRITGDSYRMLGAKLEAKAGCTLLTLIHATAAEGLGGWEKLAGIPGSIGGAVRGNAGAFGPEIRDFVTWVRALNSITGDVHEFSNAECEFDYRMSFFKKNPEWIILGVHLAFEQGESLLSKQKIEETIAEREKRHIQNVKAAGSFFMNPVAPLNIVSQFELEKGVKSRGSRVPAGWLIEKAGMKGLRLGGAQCSDQQANYIVNVDYASAENVRELAQKIKKKVRQQFDVSLQEEAVVF